jgi:hypothetical protein
VAGAAIAERRSIVARVPTDEQKGIGVRPMNRMLAENVGRLATVGANSGAADPIAAPKQAGRRYPSNTHF